MIVSGILTACATIAIIDEYEEIVQEIIDRKQGHINKDILTPLIKTLEIIEPISNIKICRDPDDDKFINCAKDARALYIVSGDKYLLVLEQGLSARPSLLCCQNPFSLLLGLDIILMYRLLRHLFLEVMRGHLKVVKILKKRTYMYNTTAV